MIDSGVLVDIGVGAVAKNKLVMAIRGDNLVYLADGNESSMDKVKKSFSAFLKVPVVDVYIDSDCDIKELRENAVTLNEKYKYLLD